MNQAGYHFFTSNVDLCTYVEHEVLAVAEVVT